MYKKFKFQMKYKDEVYGKGWEISVDYYDNK